MNPTDIVATATGTAGVVAVLTAGILRLWSAYEKQNARKDVLIDSLLAADVVKTATLSRVADTLSGVSEVVEKLTEEVRLSRAKPQGAGA